MPLNTEHIITDQWSNKSGIVRDYFFVLGDTTKNSLGSLNDDINEIYYKRLIFRFSTTFPFFLPSVYLQTDFQKVDMV